MLNELKDNKLNQGNYVYCYSWLKLTRPMTFTGTISPALAGTLLASQHGTVRMDIFFSFLIAALLVQATVNMWNDYFDFRNGQDKEKWRRAEALGLMRGPEHRRIPVVTAIIVSVLIGIGLFLAFYSSYWVAIVGAVGIAVGFAYSAGNHSLASRGLGELVAGIFLGPVVTTLAYVVQGNAINLHILSISLPFAFLIASMILTNNIRDIEKDKAFRRTQAIKLGRVKAVRILTMLLAFPYLSIIGLIYYEVVSMWVIICIFALPLAVRLRWSFRLGASREDEIGGMKWAAWHHWAFGLLFVLGLGLF